ncbi:MAG: TerC/Alx family metal homeostasis membrane protein [Phycisphaerales bacterium]|nr:TerC/Alx family metal homeostasis membrane protein [Phycisphaerales bacterium]MCB9854255.1 TerC/Alx family metal homeostasis membrane protein [Phycisphaerales bacterium]MCB9864737.1 TerC/Alx family metal homeostasis membrane protein [Phycisphaerales bacterium]
MIWAWSGFLLFICLLLALDLGVIHRKPHEVSTRAALAWSAAWISVALGFNVLVYFGYEHHWVGLGDVIGHELSGRQAGIQFLTGYVIEKSLSLDNIFIIALLFSYFQVPPAHQHRVLFWGILGAIVLRGLMILAGTALIERFEWIVYVFGAMLLLTAVKMLMARHDNLSVERNPLVRLARRYFPITEEYHGAHFLVRRDGRLFMTPLCLVILAVESSDVLFAVDSIPAIFSVTRDPFIVFSSNILAILGLRALYFALAGAMRKFRYLKMSLVFILAFVGVKMLLVHVEPVPTSVSLAVICGILMVGIAASCMPGEDPAALEPPPLAKSPPSAIKRTAVYALRQARRLIVLIVGSSVVLFGIVLFFTPGPAIVVIPIGLLILGTEFVWARQLLKRFKDEARKWTGGKDRGKPGDSKSKGAENVETASPETP